MRKSRRAVRHAILLHLVKRLSDQYNVQIPDQGPALDALSDYEVDGLLSFRSDFELEELRSALTRLAAGTYGICIGCKKPIEQALLDHVPAMRICPRCESEFNHDLQISADHTIWTNEP
ncbi:MAG TPA: hypothetical protein VL221_03495 [Bacteroidota bacterium]|nr:hypothetical protein [Bacteroidota bacterium]